ncbi:MAG TPA: DUF6677 family protein [Thermoanaerobaculia bacterium]|jgi:hypothetical protein|nr:DUF6677 family protein [Thermoanaerobaculia bacterium]
MRSRTWIAVILAFLFPGLGHLYLGRKQRGLAFFGIVVFLFLLGLAVDGTLYTIQPGNLLSVLATLGSMGSGALYFIGRMVADAHGGFGDIRSITFEHGKMFTLTAGLMNLLLVLDAFDLAEGRKE